MTTYDVIQVKNTTNKTLQNGIDKLQFNELLKQFRIINQ